MFPSILYLLHRAALLGTRLGASCATPERSFISSWARWTRLNWKLKTQLHLARSRLRPQNFFSLLLPSFLLIHILKPRFHFKGNRHSHAAHWCDKSEAQATTPPPWTAKTFSPSTTEHGSWKWSVIQTTKGIDARTKDPDFRYFSLLPRHHCEYFSI